MLITNRPARFGGFLLKLLVVIVLVLALARLSAPRLETSADALKSFHQKLETLKQAHRAESRATVRISALELNSFYHAIRFSCGSVWPPPESVFYINGQDSGFYYRYPDHRLILGHVRLRLRGTTIDTDSVVVWFGILPLPVSAIRRTLKAHPLDMEKEWTLPDYVGGAHIEGGELFLDSQ
jgi:hypothetical protein